MQTHQAKRVAIIIEQVMQRRLTEVLKDAGVTGFTILPVLGGSGRSGEWSREGQGTRAGGRVQVVCVITPERLDPLLAAAVTVVERHIWVVTVSGCAVLRGARF